MYLWMPLSITSKLHWLNLGPYEFRLRKHHSVLV